MDKTPLYLNMPPCTTVQKIGSKKVNIWAQRQENWRITAILIVLASGQKFPPLLIFKAKEGKDTKKKLQKLISVKSRRVFAYLQENAWNNENIMLKWISEVWRKYLFFGLTWRTLLVLDNTTIHKTSKVKEKFKECDTLLSMIPSGLSWKLQPLDISINKVLKENLRKRYVNDCIIN